MGSLDGSSNTPGGSIDQHIAKAHAHSCEKMSEEGDLDLIMNRRPGILTEPVSLAALVGRVDHRPDDELAELHVITGDYSDLRLADRV